MRNRTRLEKATVRTRRPEMARKPLHIVHCEVVPQSTQADTLFNPLSPDFIRDPYPFYAGLREIDPLHRSPLGFRAVSGHASASAILRDRRFGKDYAGRMARRFGEAILEEPAYRTMSLWMLQQDPPDHTRLRGLVVKAFTARCVENMRPRIQAIVDGILDRVIPERRMDLIADFAFPLPVTVICDMLSIPEAHRAMFFPGARSSGRLLEPVPLTRAELNQANSGSQLAGEYFRGLFALRRREPGDDLITELVHAEEEGSKLTNEELTANIILLFGAGHETAVNLIGNGLLALFRNPGQLRLLKENPSLLGNAIEELLRYDSSVQVTGRTALKDVMLGDALIEKGESLLCLLGAANRDPAAYREPDRLDIGRENIRPLSFGGGIHLCLGAQLARIEAEIAIGTLIRRIPDLALDDPGNPDWRPAFVLRGLKALPAHW